MKNLWMLIRNQWKYYRKKPEEEEEVVVTFETEETLGSSSVTGSYRRRSKAISLAEQRAKAFHELMKKELL